MCAICAETAMPNAVVAVVVAVVGAVVAVVVRVVTGPLSAAGRCLPQAVFFFDAKRRNDIRFIPFFDAKRRTIILSHPFRPFGVNRKVCSSSVSVCGRRTVMVFN